MAEVRALLVENEPTLARAVQRGLTTRGLLTDVAADGLTGTRAALTNTYDVVIIDIRLPHLSGHDVCRQIRAAGVWTPVIMLSAQQDLDLTDVFELGADDHLTKPFSIPVLAARLRALIRRGEVERPLVLSAGDLELDPATSTVHRAGEVLDLTPREFGLLHHLMRHKGLVLSRLDILKAVWDLHHDGADDNVVEVYVGYLRRKIDRPFGRNAIETVRGAGYRLSADGG